MKEVELSARMAAVAGLVTPGRSICDVGCDHGYVSIYLVQKGISPKVIALDVNKGPLERAGEHIKEAGLSDYIETRLSDGLKKVLPGECDGMICAGMGGRLVVHILEDGKEQLAEMQEWILQPQSDLEYVRKYLYENRYVIVKETIILEEGKFYPVMKVQHGAAPEKQGLPLYQKYGPCLLEERNQTLRQFLCWRKEQLLSIKQSLQQAGKTSEKGQGRICELMEEIKDIELALRNYE